MDTLEQWRIFVRVADTGAFSRAASELGLSQPAASRAVAELEHRYGARLLHRTTRKLSLTEAGERAYRRALTLIEEADALEAEVRGADREPVGLLRITSAIALARAEITPHASAFLSAYPRMRLDFATSDRRVDLVAEGIDLAFRLGELDDSALMARRLGAYRRLLVAAPSLAARLGALTTPDDLAGAPCIIFTTTGSPYAWTLSRGAESTRVAVDGPVRASTGRVVRDLALQGLGVALTPCFLVREDIASGALLQVMPDWLGEPMPLHAVWTARALPRKARAFLDFIAPRLTAA